MTSNACKIFLAASVLWNISIAHAEESYTEQIKKKLDTQESQAPTPSSETPYLDKIKEENPGNGDNESYTEKLKKKLGEEEKASSYTGTERAKLPAGEEDVSAIDEYNKGHTELQLKKKGEIRHAFGFRLGAAETRNFTGGSQQANAFAGVYGATWAPDFLGFFEWRPLHHEHIAGLGLFGSAQLSKFYGHGAFVGNSSPFPQSSQTGMHFWQGSLTVGPVFRLNALHFLRPYVMAGPSFVTYLEARDDGRPSLQGFSKGYFGSVGVAILMDWLSKQFEWDLYVERGIKHSYVTVDYSILGTFASSVNFSNTTFSIGITFEY